MGGSLGDERVAEFRFQLGQAMAATECALQILEGKDGPKRSFLYRILLSRALRVLIGLYGLEQLQKVNEQRGTYQ